MSSIRFLSTQNEIKFLKTLTTSKEILSSAITLEKGGFLVGINYQDLKNDNLIETLYKWRIKNINAYPSRNKTSIESTYKWLEKHVLNNENKILFKVIDEGFNLIGHIGFVIDLKEGEFIVEIDNVIRGLENVSPGIMTDSLNELIKFTNNSFFCDKVILRVLKSNNHAINFYSKNDFKINSEYSLKKEETSTGYNLVKINDDELSITPFDYFVIMERQNFLRKEKLILTAGPSISSREKVYSADAAENGWNSNWSKYLTAFEKEFAKYIGVKYAISTSSCTGAMHIALMALGIGKGDEVIVPDITWVSTANAVRLVGAIPVFADVNLSTWTIDRNSIESLITNKTKAIIPVHLYGHPCEMDEIMDLSKKYNLKIIEDAAPSIGAKYKSKKTGSFGDFSAFSFQGAKLLVTGEGGMLCTNDKVLYEKAYKIWDQGRIPGSFWIEELGVKYKMSNMQAALGLAQLERNDLMVEAKRNINNIYFNRLSNHSKVNFFIESKNARSIYWMTSIRLVNTNLTREDFCAKLKERLIDTRPVFPSISQYPYWPKKQDPQPNSKLIAETGINLPSGVCLSKEQVDYVCDNIIEILDNE
jgi:perosamine synthetase